MSKESVYLSRNFAAKLGVWLKLDKFLTLAILAATPFLFCNVWHLAARLLSQTFTSLPPTTGSIFQPLQFACILIIAISVYAKVSQTGIFRTRNDVEVEAAFFKAYSGLTAAERQIRFAALYKIQPSIDVIDILIYHPTDPLGVISLYSSAGEHVVRKESWFSLASDWHLTKLWVLMIFFTISGLFAVSALAAGLWMTLSSQPPFAQLISGPTALAEGLILSLATSAMLQDVQSYALSYRLIAADPKSADESID
ncbi:MULTISPECIES: hypothetical protein [unclassified Rhizobium]|uniref:hypothetical protein n=1 Tax=unclassified Rhizobium TaxID=2613769 RepID=UPI00177AA15C|nr:MULTISPECIES: hypothetical protein [unclassified Rhizobium]MBD8689559.1 hypothetical protein [Rhizobium sp. CFBP 13644]MBD8693919.1 hypothetical protein [Rhizobium sp. CFBP 13717]